jgi:hypothetical protein
MTAFVKNCDRIRSETRAHVMIVHHTGKDVAAGSRGHSSLRAATDTEIEITRDDSTGISSARVTKQRDRAILERHLSFTLEPVALGQDGRGKDIVSCVVQSCDAPAAPARTSGPRITPAARNALSILSEAVDTAGTIPPASNHIPPNTRAVNESIWRSYCYERSISSGDSEGAKRKAFTRAAESLQAAKLISIWNGLVWPT